MTSKLEAFWPTSNQHSDWLGIVANWSLPLAQTGLSPKAVSSLEQELLQELELAVTEGIREGFHPDHAPATRYEINQRGSAAEYANGIFAWLTELPSEVVVALLAERTARGLAVVAGFAKGRIESFRRDLDGHEITANIEFHPDFLLQLCTEFVLERYGPIHIKSSQWRSLTDREQLSLGDAWPPSEHYWIEILGDRQTFRMRVDDMGTLHEFSVNGAASKPTFIVPDVNPIPVAVPTFQDPHTGIEVTQWPSQDGIDRSESLAIIAILSPEFGYPIEDMEFVERAGHISDQVRTELQRAVRSAVNEIIPDLSSQQLTANHYQVGPAASGLAGLEHYIVELVQSRDALPALIGNLSEAWVIYEIVSRVQRHLKSWISQFGESRLDIEISFSPAMLSELCEQYVRLNLHPRAKLISEWACLTANFYGGYVSPGHPTTAVEYLVTVSTATRAYRFRVWGNGEVVSLWLRQGKIEVQLATPSLFGDENYG